MCWQQLKYPLRLVSYFVVLTMALCCTACTDTRCTGSDRKRVEWKVGYWYWQGWRRTDTGVTDKEQVPIDLFYVHTGEYITGNPYAKPEAVDMSWPERDPPGPGEASELAS